MGSIENLNAEPRTYIPNNRSQSNSQSPSRIQRDLSSSPHQESYMNFSDEQQRIMIRTAAGKIPHVCVVGAGVAGLRCADVLLQHGVKVTVLEGRDRVGGRLCQNDTLGHLVDLGPNWIHGTDHNPILELAKKTNTHTINWDGRQSVFDHLGHHMSDEDAAKNTEIVWDVIEKAMKKSNEESDTIPTDTSLYDFFEEQVDIMFPPKSSGQIDEQARSKRRTILQMAEMWGAFVGSPVQKQSLKFLWLEECIDGENLFVAETYHKILQKIAEPALKANIRFGNKVTKIISHTDGDTRVTLEVDGASGQEFDEVVMTAPLGWLKRNTQAFEPELPKTLKEGIDAIGYGHLDKVYINFPSAFWNESQSTKTVSLASSRNADILNVTATPAPYHQNPLDDPSDSPVNQAHYPGSIHWTAPSYASDTNPRQWNQEAVNLAALPDSHAHPTLLFYIFGPTSQYIAKLLSSSPASNHDDLLNAFFEPYYSRLPNYDSNNPDSHPKQFLATLWANDELAGYGSYSNFQVGLENGNRDIEVMRRGLPERGVWLAGEHTAPFVALGTVTGAYWAGEGVAKRIVRAYGLDEKNTNGVVGREEGSI